ncbi:LCP family protein [Aquibacillus albus]|uniref:LCP family protein required for cell wall assembly n=1 Tax=Aquibacillus albus TaxID=1168171 RepID=A0ABS2MX59_9BACI|nr:LCP family protein [Aquibacillus albus]MBM7570436.1 LCP family protein required for cell wall assembly [Aquibacillus albus]
MTKRYHSRIQKRKIKKSHRKKILWVLIPILFLLGATSVYGALLYNKAEEVMNESHVDDGRDKSERRTEAPDPKKDNVSVLFIGIDSSDKRGNQDSARSDALILATLNKEDKSVKLLSIPRDSYVYIPELGYSDKINHAHAYGGAKASIETVEELFDIPVDYYVRLNFEAFIDVVDSLNGITVDVPFELYEQDSNDRKNAIHLLPGEQQLNGEEALALARTRKLDNDIERGKRQQDIIKAIVKRAASLDSIFRYDDVIEAVGANMQTNMEFDEMKSFTSYRSLDIEALTLKGSDYWPGDVYYYQLDEADVAAKSEILQNHLELNEETEASTN